MEGYRFLFNLAPSRIFIFREIAQESKKSDDWPPKRPSFVKAFTTPFATSFHARPVQSGY